MGKLSNISPFKGFEKTDPLFDKWLGILWGALRGDITTDGLINGVGAPTLGTVQATTSGTAWDFTDIPSWASFILVGFDQFSTNGTSNGRLQLGTASGPVTSGYTSATASLIDAGAVAADNGMAGFLFNTNVAAASVRQGIAILVKMNATTNTWACGILMGASNNTRVIVGGGTIVLTDPLTQIRVTTVSGDTGDGGSINIRVA